MARLLNPRPFLKWAGGKTQIVDELLNRIPGHFDSYHEPFVGGGALFFRLYRDSKIRHALISDLNAELIDTYIAIRDQVEDVIKLLAEYPHAEDFFYKLRSEDPWKMDFSARTARMIYLNKTGYNGLYRVNRQGKFNVPFGCYKNPEYCDVSNLRAASSALQDVEIAYAPFEKVLEKAKGGDFVYFDPPYVPLSKTANFTAYHANGFTPEDQIRLRDVCVELTKMNVNVMLSNSATDTVRALYAQPGFILDEIQANRAINSNGSGRGKLAELIVTNYSVSDENQSQLLQLDFNETAKDARA